MAEDQKKNIKELLEIHPSLKVTKDGKKIKCSLTGHEMPYNLTAIQSYIKGKKYQKSRAKHDFEKDKVMQHLQLGRGKWQEMLYCKLTCRYISHEAIHIQRHIQGKRFLRALQRWEECKKAGIEFKPRQPMSKPATDKDPTEDEDDSDEADEENSDEEMEFEVLQDDLEDLYPASDFESSGSESDRPEAPPGVAPQALPEESGSDSDFDVEEMLGHSVKTTTTVESPEDIVGNTAAPKRTSKKEKKTVKKQKVAPKSETIPSKVSTKKKHSKT